ncbi:MAG TPA: pyruvate dehydrogenase, partial [Opitutae bacterium]|nr:pyruvate dehydrogenase [Opitutae bacterium]
MATLIDMPKLSDTMTVGTLVKWLKNEGDAVTNGDMIAEVETDKATMEFESFNEGELLHIGIQEGGTAPVDTLLAIIGKKGEDISNIIKGDSIEKEDNDNISETTKTVSEEDSKSVIPDEVEIINMPRLSDTMEEGTVAKWFKKVGDKVNEGDILAEIETDKATMEFESFYNGKLVHIGVSEGETVKVDDLIAIISDSDVDVDDLLSNYG